MTQQPRLCIATGRYLRAGETFVNRHIEHLFGGNTVVVCGRRTGRSNLNKPVFGRLGASLNPVDLLTAPWEMYQNHVQYRAPFVPFGKARVALEAFLRREKVDAILAEFGSQAISIWPVARHMGVPVFTYFRGRDASRYLENPTRVEGYHRMMPNLTGIFAVSGFLLDNLAACGLRHPNAHVIPSGTDTSAFRPGPKDPGQMVFVGRFVEKKAPRLTLESFLTIADRHPQARLDFIGDGPELKACQARASNSIHGGRVTFHGRLTQSQVQAHLARASIFVLHSVKGRDGETEGLPSAIQEAMACGAAILSTRHAGIPELVASNETGVLVDERARADLTAAMDKLLANPEATLEMGRKARAVAQERIDFRALYGQVEEVIRQGIDEHTRNRHP